MLRQVLRAGPSAAARATCEHVFESFRLLTTMRWDNLRLIDRPEGMSVPLFEQGAVARTFDTPEFRGITFYEVQAKSIINRVPEASRSVA